MGNFNLSSYHPTYLPCKFASGSEDAKVFQHEGGDSVDIRNGLKPVLTRKLESEINPDGSITPGGTALTRMDVNGMFGLASDIPFFLQCGGVFTFNREQSELIGGYPKDAILVHKFGSEFHYIRSLKDDNMDNFVEDPSCIGKSWKYCDSPLIYPDYSHPILPDPNYEPTDGAGQFINHFMYGYGGKNGCVEAKTLRGNKVVEFGPEVVFDDSDTSWHHYNTGAYWDQVNKAVYFRVRAHSKNLTKAPEFFEGKNVDSKVMAAGAYTEGARLFLKETGWFYLSLAHLASSNYKTTQACGNIYYTYSFGFPDNAIITMREANEAESKARDFPNNIALSGPYDGGGKYIISSSFANNSTRHQSWSWSMQMITRANTLVQIWNGRKMSWDMFYNLFGFLK